MHYGSGWRLCVEEQRDGGRVTWVCVTVTGEAGRGCTVQNHPVLGHPPPGLLAPTTSPTCSTPIPCLVNPALAQLTTACHNPHCHVLLHPDPFHRFYELAGHYPETITVVSYTLKESRFRSLHRDAVRWPAEDFKFVGTPVPPEAKGAEVRVPEALRVSDAVGDYGGGGNRFQGW